MLQKQIILPAKPIIIEGFMLKIPKSMKAKVKAKLYKKNSKFVYLSLFEIILRT